MAPQDRAVIRLLLVAAFVVVLHETVVGVVIPHLRGDLGITATARQWLPVAVPGGDVDRQAAS